MTGRLECGGLGNTNQADNIFRSSESPRSTENNLAFSGIRVIYDGAADSDLGSVSEEPIADRMEEQGDTRTECSEEMSLEDVEIGGKPIRALVSNGCSKDDLQEAPQKDNSVFDRTVVDLPNPNVEEPASESSDSIYPQSPSGATDLSDGSILEVVEMGIGTKHTKRGSSSHMGASTQTEDLDCDDIPEPPADPAPTPFGIFNMSVPKVSLTGCLLYGGVALYLGHQAYRAFHR